MKFLKLFLIPVLMLTASAYGLTSGDIAFTAFNADGDDDFAIVALSDIPANSTIYFTDNEPDADGSGFLDYNEGTLQWSTGASVISAGTVVIFTDTDGGSNPSFGASIGTLSIASFDAGMNLSGGGDAMYAVEGDPESKSITAWLAGIQNAAGNQGDNFSQTGLVSGSTFIEAYPSSSPDGSYYSGDRSGQTNFSDYLTLLNNTSNWTFSTSDGELILPISSTAFTITGGSVSVDDPTSFAASAVSASQIDLSWVQNANTDNVMIVYNTDGIFTDPENGTAYTISSSALGGTVIYLQSGTSYSHTSLSGGTTYYYKIWSVDGSNNYSPGVSVNATTIKAEPSNHIADLASSSTYNSISLTWTDNDGAIAADGFIVKASSTSLEAITSPTDNNEETDDADLSDGTAVLNISHGVQSCEFTGLNAESNYYVKIWPYSNSGSDIDYKTGGTIPSQSVMTAAAPDVPKLFISEVADPADVYAARFIELYNNSGSTIDFDSDVWYVCRQTNGGTTWEDKLLTGSVAAGDVYVLANNNDDAADAFYTNFGFLADYNFGGSSGNGDDAYFLYKGGDHTSGMLVDIYGVIDIDGSGYDWEYTDAAAVRTPETSQPNSVWTASEWTITPSANIADCTPGVHSLTGATINDPDALTAVGMSATQIYLSWALNGNGDQVLIVYDQDNTFSDPINGNSYSVSASELGGTVIYSGSDTSFSHTGLSGASDYYYKAWSFDASHNYSMGISANATTVTAEPDNHVADLAGTSTYNSITLTWSDNDGLISAHQYLIVADTSSLVAITNPVDGAQIADDTDLSDGSGAINVAHGTQTYTWSGLDASTSYYFKIFPYTNTDANTDYYTAGTIPSLSIATTSMPRILISEIMINPDAVSDLNGEWFELFNAGSETVNIDGWQISDNGTDIHTIDNGGALNIEAGDFLVLGIDNDTLTNGNYTCDYKYSNFSLSNSGDEIILKSGSATIDSVAYDDGTIWTIPVGASLVYIGDPYDDNNLYDSWMTSEIRGGSFGGITGDLGTPGAGRIIDGILNIKVFIEGALPK
jgi:hypothetical protein